MRDCNATQSAMLSNVSALANVNNELMIEHPLSTSGLVREHISLRFNAT